MAKQQTLFTRILATPNIRIQAIIIVALLVIILGIIFVIPRSRQSQADWEFARGIQEFRAALESDPDATRNEIQSAVSQLTRYLGSGYYNNGQPIVGVSSNFMDLSFSEKGSVSVIVYCSYLAEYDDFGKSRGDKIILYSETTNRRVGEFSAKHGLILD